MLHGRGEQNWLTETIEDYRRRALVDRTGYSDSDLTKWEVEFPKGGGRTDIDNYREWQIPFPINTSVKERERINLLDLYPIR